MDDLVLRSYLESSKPRIIASLVDWVRIPSVSADPEHAGDVEASARFCAQLLRDAGLERVELLAVTGNASQGGTGSGGTGSGGTGSGGTGSGGTGPGGTGPGGTGSGGTGPGGTGPGGTGPGGTGPGGTGPGDASHGGGGPAVYGEWLHAGEQAPTVLIYGHYDVQPADPLDEWRTTPFDPIVTEDEVVARGASDDKGQVLMQAEAVRGLMSEHGGLPVNLKVLVEGEEEVGSPHFEALLEREKARLAADIIVISDTTMVGTDVPSTTVGMRGLCTFDVTLRTARSDLHSGIWGGTVPNAAVVAARLAAALHDTDGRVTLPGFYDDVAELSEREARSLAAIPFEEADFCHKAGVNFLEGERGRTPYERTGSRPTAEVVGLHSGYGGPGMKTIVPATANLKVACRLVPHQQPADVIEGFQRWLVEQLPVGVESHIANTRGAAPIVTDVEHPAVAVLSRAIERVWGKAPLFERSGGSGPEEALTRVLGAPLLFLGVSLPEDNFHAPNEKLDISQLWRGVLAAGELLLGLGRDLRANGGRP